MLTTVYLGGKMFGSTLEETAKLVRAAMGFQRKLFELGFWVFCPATNCLLAQFAIQVMLERIVVGNLTQMEHCDIVFMPPNWKASLEANTERAHALMLHKPVFYSIPQVKRWLEKGGGSSS